jgi:hypothetical protein
MALKKPVGLQVPGRVLGQGKEAKPGAGKQGQEKGKQGHAGNGSWVMNRYEHGNQAGEKYVDHA